MRNYFIRRLLLVPVTLIGVTFLVFMITRIVPGGPIERQLQEAALSGETGGGQKGVIGGMSEDLIEELEEAYGYDQPALIAYAQWLGLWPREHWLSKGEFKDVTKEQVERSTVKNPENETLVVLKGSGRQLKVLRKGTQVASMEYLDKKGDAISDGWSARIESPEDRKRRWMKRTKGTLDDAPDHYDYRVLVYQRELAGIFQGEFGNSSLYGDPVWSLMKERLPVALYFGILTAIITYGVSLPLGILKAIHHRTAVDHVSSVLIFVGYAIPGFALGALMLLYFGVHLQWLPLFGLDSLELSDLPWWTPERLVDRAKHTIMPLLCYVIGGFAFKTMLMKNSLMEQLAADYVRTAVAKGMSFRRAVLGHAFRNAFIPVASNLGGLITMIVGGSIFVEKVFDIQGFGLLQYQAVLGRDQFVIMGTLTLSALLLMLGNLLSDLIVSLVDPRVTFGK